MQIMSLRGRKSGAFHGKMPNTGKQKRCECNRTMEGYGYKTTNCQYTVQRKRLRKNCKHYKEDVRL